MRFSATAFCLALVLLLGAKSAIFAENLPKDCEEAMEVRSPQAQIDLFTKCLESGGVSGSERATTLKQRAVAYMHLGQHQRAVDDATQSIRLKPGDADAYYLRAVSYRALGEYRQSLDDSNRAIGIEGDFAAAYANRAFVHKAMGNTSQAKSDANRAKSIDARVKVPSF